MKICVLPCMVFLLSGQVLAESTTTSEVFGGSAKSVEGFTEQLRASPREVGSMQEVVFTSNRECLAYLQGAIATGAFIASAMPFSSVVVYEGEKGPTARFRIMLNGDRLHSEAYCDDNNLTWLGLGWGSGNGEKVQVSGSISEALLSLRLLGISEGKHNEEPAEQRVTEPSMPLDKIEMPSELSLTKSEEDALIIAIQQCWNVGALSMEALRTTVVVEISLTQDGVPEAGSIAMVESDGETESATKQAFEAARRAVIRCGARGFPLPQEKYDTWRITRLVFDPNGVRVE